MTRSDRSLTAGRDKGPKADVPRPRSAKDFGIEAHGRFGLCRRAAVPELTVS